MTFSVASRVCETHAHKIPVMKCRYCGKQGSELVRVNLNTFFCPDHPCPVYMRFALTDGSFRTIGVSLILVHRHKFYEMYMEFPPEVECPACPELEPKQTLGVYSLAIEPEGNMQDFHGVGSRDQIIYETDSNTQQLTPDNAQDKLLTYLTFS